MIQPGTYVNVIDNSGAKIAYCIHIFRKYKRKPGTTGNFVKVSIKELRRKGKIRIKKKSIYLGLIVQSKKNKPCSSGNLKTFYSNSIILLNNNNKMIGNRIYQVIDSKLRQNLQLKPILLSYNFL